MFDKGEEKQRRFYLECIIHVIDLINKHFGLTYLLLPRFEPSLKPAFSSPVIFKMLL